VEEPKRRNWQVSWICALLVLLVFLVFGQTLRFDFVNYDDNTNVYQAPEVTAGISLHGIAWAFTHTQVRRWAPVTTISRQIDYELYGLWAGGHHLSNVLLHVSASVFLFLALLELTRFIWRSASVAAVFALHPLHVESVAWVSARGDLLSGLFFMLTLLAYARYARRGESKRRYTAVMVWFALGLMSKPVLVTVPFILLLLDYWPLGRLVHSSQFPRLLKEKLPLLGISALSCVATVFAQKETNQFMDHIPFFMRVGNALVGYCVYLGKTFYPAGLTVFYPTLKNGFPVWEVAVAILLLTVLTRVAWVFRRKQPFILVGWLWYLGMLVPVIGVVQVGEQAYADRYTYLSQIGLCLAGAWATAVWARKWSLQIAEQGSLVAAILCVLLAVSYNQTSYWRNSETLWRHAIDCTEDDALARNNLGIVLFYRGQVEEAAALWRQALQINPAYAEAHNNLGYALFREGRTNDAIVQYREALRIDPTFALAHNYLGIALFGQGRAEEAIAEFQEALRDNPSFAEAEARYYLGLAQFQLGQSEQAIAQIEKTVDLQPGDKVFQSELAWMLATAPRISSRNGARAVKLATQASQSSGNTNPGILRILAAAYAEAGEFPNAVQTAQKALQLAETQPDTTLANKLRREIKLYQANHPFENVR